MATTAPNQIRMAHGRNGAARSKGSGAVAARKPVAKALRRSGHDGPVCDMAAQSQTRRSHVRIPVVPDRGHCPLRRCRGRSQTGSAVHPVAPHAAVWVSGVFGLLGAGGLLFAATRRASGMGFFALTILVTPVHVYMSALEFASYKLGQSLLQRPGDGYPVVIFPGLGTHGSWVATLRDHCCSLGYEAFDRGQGFNTGPKATLTPGWRI